MLCLAVLLHFGACLGFGPGPSLPETYTVIEASEIPPPSLYRKWYHELRECSELRAPYSSITWFVAQGLKNDEDIRLNGVYFREAITLDIRSVADEWTVKHEMLHYLLHRNAEDPDGAHAGPLWRECIPPP